MTDKPTLFHCPQTRSNAPFWLNEELGEPCAVELIDIKKRRQKDDDYLKVNPMGKVPALKHQKGAITEAAAICLYLADYYDLGGLAPKPEAEERGSYLRWVLFAPACIEPAIWDALNGSPEMKSQALGHGTVRDVSNAIDEALNTGPYLLGQHFSAADIVFGSTLNFATRFGAFEKTSRRAEYLDQIMSRPAAVAAATKNLALAADMGW